MKRRYRKIEKPAIGSYSHGSLLTEDILDGIEELLPLRIVNDIRRALRRDDEEEASRLLNDVALPYINDRCPVYTVFDSRPGDGSDFGCWIDWDAVEDNKGYDILSVDDLSEVASDYIGEVLHTNDHGNATLYWKSARKFTEIWSVV